MRILVLILMIFIVLFPHYKKIKQLRRTYCGGCQNSRYRSPYCGANWASRCTGDLLRRANSPPQQSQLLRRATVAGHWPAVIYLFQRPKGQIQRRVNGPPQQVLKFRAPEPKSSLCFFFPCSFLARFHFQLVSLTLSLFLSDTENLLTVSSPPHPTNPQPQPPPPPPPHPNPQPQPPPPPKNRAQLGPKRNGSGLARPISLITSNPNGSCP